MKKPFFIAETPRAGHRGHRFIVPVDLEISSIDVETFFQKAALKIKGRDFVSVNRQVKQLLPSGSVRNGTETLMLAGVSTSALNQQEIDNLNKTLRKRLKDLEQLVTADINWEKEGQKTLVIRKEMADWLRESGMDNLSASTPRAGNNKAILLGSLFGVLTGLLILYLYMMLGL